MLVEARATPTVGRQARHGGGRAQWGGRVSSRRRLRADLCGARLANDSGPGPIAKPPGARLMRRRTCRADGAADRRAEESFLLAIDEFREIGNEKEAAGSSRPAVTSSSGRHEGAKERLREARALMRRIGFRDEKVDATLAPWAREVTRHCARRIRRILPPFPRGACALTRRAWRTRTTSRREHEETEAATRTRDARGEERDDEESDERGELGRTTPTRLRARQRCGPMTTMPRTTPRCRPRADSFAKGKAPKLTAARGSRRQGRQSSAEGCEEQTYAEERVQTTPAPTCRRKSGPVEQIRESPWAERRPREGVVIGKRASSSALSPSLHSRSSAGLVTRP